MDWSVISWQVRWWINLGGGTTKQKFTKKNTTLYLTLTNMFQKKPPQSKKFSIYILIVETDIVIQVIDSFRLTQ